MSSCWPIVLTGRSAHRRSRLRCGEILDFIVEVRTLDHAVHSGVYGGPVPDALTALSRPIASLHDNQGNVAIESVHLAELANCCLNEAILLGELAREAQG
jgi:Peptidase dimerisation domain